MRESSFFHPAVKVAGSNDTVFSVGCDEGGNVEREPTPQQSIDFRNREPGQHMHPFDEAVRKGDVSRHGFRRQPAHFFFNMEMGSNDGQGFFRTDGAVKIKNKT